MLDFVERKTAEFIGSGILGETQSQKGEQTAHEIQQMQFNSIKNLGLIVLAFMRAKRDMSYLRIYNLAENFVSPIKRKYDPLSNKITNVFSKFTINDVIFNNGKKGKKIIQFSDKPLTPEEKESIYKYEQREATLGRPVQIRSVNTKLLSSIPLFWCVTVNPQPRDGSQLQKVLFKDMLDQGAAIQAASQGQKQIEWEKAAEKFERVWETKDFFKKEAPQTMQNGQPQSANPDATARGEEMMKDINHFESSAVGSQATEPMRRNSQRPSINRIEDNV